MVKQTLEDGFKGASTGWNHGFAGVFEHCRRQYNWVVRVITGSLSPLSARDFPTEMSPPQYPPAMVWVSSLFRELQAGSPSPSRDLLDELMLSSQAFCLLKANQPLPLNAEELKLLASDQSIKKQLSKYMDLRERLEIKPLCCITLETPEKENTLLLVKLYSRDGEEFPVPNQSHIFDKPSLAQWLKNNNTHPLDRDVLNHPSSYEGFNTRYICHPYYPPDSDTGISQELSENIRVLRAHLTPNQPSLPLEINGDRNRIRAARLRYFDSSLNADAANNAEVNVPNNSMA